MESTIVPIGLRASTGKELSFTVDALNLPKEVNVFLEDRLTNTFTQLNVDNSEYKITLTESIDGIGRFYLHTASSVLSVGKDLSLEGVSIYKTNKSTLRIVRLQKGKTNVKIFNILGKQIMNSSFESNKEEITRKEAIKKNCNYGKYAALTALGTYMILNPQKAHSQSIEALGEGF
ncbi:hypothetical protein [uncultured Polaribacter sp.]|uniref:hypothetical protein n=1 Tax=uncultured Polaribacter sp. TaxID=174711 RepID=UPI00260C84B2|nr:hypothetical protein [uncultured Polaribacter sp.]